MESISRSTLQTLAVLIAIVAAASLAACDAAPPTSGGGPSTVCTVELSATDETQLRKAIEETLRSTSPCDPAGLRTAFATSAQAAPLHAEIVRLDDDGKSFRAEVEILSGAQLARTAE